MPNPRLSVAGGVAGVVGVCCYVLAITVPWPETQLGISGSLLVVGAWPLLSIVYSYALYAFVAEERESAANRLGLLFAVAAFTTVLAMVVVQLAVGAGLPEVTRGLDETTQRALRRGLRLIDLGLDVAWDMLIGTALVALNAASFPWPPGDRGLVDIGPLIGVFVLLLSGRLAWLGRRTLRTSATSR